MDVVEPGGADEGSRFLGHVHWDPGTPRRLLEHVLAALEEHRR